MICQFEISFDNFKVNVLLDSIDFFKYKNIVNWVFINKRNWIYVVFLVFIMK